MDRDDGSIPDPKNSAPSGAVARAAGEDYTRMGSLS